MVVLILPTGHDVGWCMKELVVCGGCRKLGRRRFKTSAEELRQDVLRREARPEVRSLKVSSVRHDR